MLLQDTLNPFVLSLVVTGLLSLYFLVGFLVQIKKVRVIASAKKLIAFSIFFLSSSSLALFIFSVNGYQTLTDEQLIATVKILPLNTAQKKRKAIVSFQNGQLKEFEISGDEIMFEANVIKWKPWANMLGLKTGYRMDRVRGRYTKLADEKMMPSTIYAIEPNETPDISEWRNKYQHLSYLLDVEHGSASYTSINQNHHFNLVITNSGLLLRPINKD